jgi:hypothetical protein
MKALGAALLVLAGVAACGEGRAIFNVDVLSFIQPSGKDTISYNFPATPITVSRDSFLPPQKVSLPSGLGNSSVDSVSVSLAGAADNQTGTGSATFEIFFAKDSASIYAPGATPYITATGTIAGPQPSTVPLLAPDTVSIADSVFNTNTLWVGVHAGFTQNAGLSGLSGKLRLTLLSLRIVLQDKVF